ncbi:MAG: TlpA family protein disulfide reductase [Myxococcaceae bacterium]
MSKLSAQRGQGFVSFLMRRGAPLLLLLGLTACAHAPDLREPKFLPFLKLTAVGPVRYTPSALRGRVVLVNFFTTWCFPCLGELPVLHKFQQEYGARGLSVVVVGLDVEEAKVLEPFAWHFKYAFPVTVASTEIKNAQTPFGRIAALPTSFLLGRDGKVVVAYQGLANSKDLKVYIEKSLEDSGG